MAEYITIGDCAAIFQGRNIDKAKLNTEGKGIPYIVGASCMKDEKMVLLAATFQQKQPQEYPKDMPDDPIELAEWFKRKSSKLLKEQNRALDKIAATIKSGWDNAPDEIIQLMLEDINNEN